MCSYKNKLQCLLILVVFEKQLHIYTVQDQATSVGALCAVLLGKSKCIDNYRYILSNANSMALGICQSVQTEMSQQILKWLTFFDLALSSSQA